MRKIPKVTSYFPVTQKAMDDNKLTKSLFGKYAELFEELDDCVCANYRSISIHDIHEDKDLGESETMPHLTISHDDDDTLRLICCWIKDRKWKQFLNHVGCGNVEETDDTTHDTIYYWWGYSISLSDPECSQKCIQVHEKIKEYFDNYANSDL